MEKIMDREGNELTKEQVIAKTIDTLAGIFVPVMAEQISGPIRAAIGNLQVVLQVMEAEKAAAEAAKAPADGPKLEIVPDEAEPREPEEQSKEEPEPDNREG